MTYIITNVKNLLICFNILFQSIKNIIKVLTKLYIFCHLCLSVCTIKFLRRRFQHPIQNKRRAFDLFPPSKLSLVYKLWVNTIYHELKKRTAIQRFRLGAKNNEFSFFSIKGYFVGTEPTC